ncbi:MAG: hypothetical protein JRN15_21695 [Nitrososphaerota archaeon]|nr:hypothetical protein [Nitrososphaerota archaeon]
MPNFTTSINVKVTPEQWTAIEAAAKKRNMTVTAFAHAVVIAASEPKGTK